LASHRHPAARPDAPRSGAPRVAEARTAVPPSAVARPWRRAFNSRPALLVAFAFAVMADPVSSVAYAIEAALRALDGDLGLLLPTMGLVIGIIALIVTNYHALVGRFAGGGDAAAAGSAFGEAWAFIPIGALVVDFVLTISISVSAAASAVIAYLPSLAHLRVPLALALLVAVAGLTWFGHIGRAVFAAMTLAFVVLGGAVIVGGLGAAGAAGGSGGGAPPEPAPIAVLLAFPVAMALATGVEAPSTAAAQLGQLDYAGRRRFARITLWLTLGIVGALTLGLTAVAVRLGVGIPPAHSTQIAEIADASVGRVPFALFQACTALLLLAAASSSFQAGPGLLKALARRTGLVEDDDAGLLHHRLGIVNVHHTPYWSVAVFLAISATVVVAAGARDQELVLFYAVSVFMSFLMGLLSMARFSRRGRRWALLAVNCLGAGAVALTLAFNLARGYPVVSMAAALAIAFALYRLWVRDGRPRGISGAVVEAETSSG
jgi:hypothetical protein